MAKYFLIHTDETAFPKLSAEELEGFQQAWQDSAKAGAVHLVRTRVGKEDRRGYCEFEAPSLAALQTAVKAITGQEWPSALVASEVETLVEQA